MFFPLKNVQFEIQQYAQAHGYRHIRGNDLSAILFGQLKPYYHYSCFWGQMMESKVKQLLVTSFNLDIRGCPTVINEESPFLMSTPDGVIVNGIKDYPYCLLEIKCPSSSRIPTQIPFKDYLQMMAHMYCCKVKCCLYVCWTPMGIVIRQCILDEPLFAQILKQLKDISKFQNAKIEPRDLIAQLEQSRLKCSRLVLMCFQGATKTYPNHQIIWGYNVFETKKWNLDCIIRNRVAEDIGFSKYNML